MTTPRESTHRGVARRPSGPYASRRGDAASLPDRPPVRHLRHRASRGITSHIVRFVPRRDRGYTFTSPYRGFILRDRRCSRPSRRFACRPVRATRTGVRVARTDARPSSDVRTGRRSARRRCGGRRAFRSFERLLERTRDGNAVSRSERVERGSGAEAMSENGPSWRR